MKIFLCFGSIPGILFPIHVGNKKWGLLLAPAKGAPPPFRSHF